MQRYYKKWAPIFLAPLLICFIGAFLVPFFMGVFFSFTKYRTIRDFSFNGVSNFVDAFGKGSTFWHALGMTVAFVCVSVILINVFALALALLLTKGLKGSAFFRSLFFMPNLIGGIVLGWIWNLILNGFLMSLGTNLYAKPAYGFWGLVLVTCWQQVGYMMVIYIAALMNVPVELTESAQIDGANKWQTIKNVTIPMIVPAITICTFLTLTNGFKLFDQNLALTGSSVPEDQLLALDIYQTMFNNAAGNMGIGQAKALVFFLIVAAISGLQVFLSRKKEVQA
ncbi:MAG: sugar ABC transporter permease [Bacilli bacterium]|jgi:raffinose/stachyose/melibiose transport system permease protein